MNHTDSIRALFGVSPDQLPEGDADPAFIGRRVRVREGTNEHSSDYWGYEGVIKEVWGCDEGYDSTVYVVDTRDENGEWCYDDWVFTHAALELLPL